MRNSTPTRSDRFGLVRPAVEAHTLGVSSVEQILRDCGYEAVVGDAAACDAFGRPEDAGNLAVIEQWLRRHRITILGFSYRLDPEQGAALFERLVHQLKSKRLFAEQGGFLKAAFFAGLPLACELVRRRVPEVAGVFRGDETPAETLAILGIDSGAMPRRLAEGIGYDEARLSFGRDLVRKGDYLRIRPIDRSAYNGFGTRSDTLVSRLGHGRERRLPPLMRAHVGPYQADRAEAVQLFLAWTRRLAESGLLDILSIGTSQLTQSNFGEEWSDRPNGGGVPINSPAEFAAVWQAARPMLVRTYAGTKNILDLARMYEDTLSMAWHTLSLWWFCRIDGRGPHTVRENLEQHIETIKYVASVGKPFEPNVPHHFAFRGGDDVTYVASAVIAAKAARRLGIRHLVLQNMLNTPKYTWGIQDLAKSRAILQLVREFEDDSFRVILQPRAGLDYLSPDLDKARAQLAAVTALMDDIEPRDSGSPPVIHVVSYSEASHLADPAVVDESIRITRCALEEYRRLRARGLVDDMTNHPEVASRTAELREETRAVINAIESNVPAPYSPAGLYAILARGFLAVPYLWECKDEFNRAIRWQTKLVHGSVKIVDAEGNPIPAATRMAMLADGL
jgi:hypothetical protein